MNMNYGNAGSTEMIEDYHMNNTALPVFERES